MLCIINGFVESIRYGTKVKCLNHQGTGATRIQKRSANSGENLEESCTCRGHLKCDTSHRHRAGKEAAAENTLGALLSFSLLSP